ncbi:MAG: CRISPR-associated endonuclease Cas1 [Deltaproteobacteria bacterium]|nr:CRISPR-associated endonuclease Cas1 [Deltaproteobacteria bacterium]
MWDELLPVSLISEIIFCPRNFYYRACEGEEGINKFVLEGSLQDEKRNERERIRTQEKIQIREVSLSSEKLGIIGVLDAVEEAGSIYPIEYKRSELKESLQHDIQLCLEAMLLEESIGQSIPYGYIYYSASKSRRRVDLTDDLRKTSLETIAQAREILYKGEIPEPVADERCPGCALFSVCLPFEVKSLKEKEPLTKRIIPELNIGKVLYVDEHGAYVGKRGGKIVITKDKKVISEAPASYLRQLVLTANANISTQAIKFLLRMNVEIVYQSSWGRFEGKFVPEESKNSLLRLAQYKSHLDEAFSLKISKKFVTGKLSNMRTLLLRQNREIGDADIEKASNGIKNILDRVAEAKEKDELLGLEGIGTREYFRVFGRLIKSKGYGFDFEKRTKRPPRDPVNALLSFGYSLLVGDMVSSLSTAGLDPYIGLFHSTKYGRPALALDLMEEFRPVTVDSLVLTLLNKGMIADKDFKEKFGGVYLEENGRETFFKAYAGRVQTEIVHPVFEYRVNYRRVFEIQARFLGKVLTGEIDEYTPFVVR